MEFNEKLQELRKQRGISQNELAKSLFVSRTAISKWESGRGYPSIESLKAIATFFSVSVDDLLSSKEILNLAQNDGREKEKRLQGLIFGLLDTCAALLFFLPLFASRLNGTVQPSTLLGLDGVQLYLKILFFISVSALTIWGILSLAFQNLAGGVWEKCKNKLSLSFSIFSLLLFVISLQPYAAVFIFVLLTIKALTLIKRR